MTPQKWISILMISLSIALACFAWLARPAFCIDSSLVEKIDSVSGEKQQTLYACKFVKNRRSYHPDLDLIKKNIESRLKHLEREAQFLGVDYKPVSISIIDTVDVVIRVHPKRLILSSSIFNQSQVFDKTILQAILLQKIFSKNELKSMSDLDANQILQVEVMSDVWLAISRGQLSLFEPLSGRMLSWNSRYNQWPLILKNPESYCEDSWRSYLSQSKCDLKNFAELSSVLSLRQLFGRMLKNALAYMPIDQQMTNFKRLIKVFPFDTIKSSERYVSKITAEDAETKSRVELSEPNSISLQDMKLYAESWIQKIIDNTTSELSDRIKSEMNSVGLVDSKVNQFDLIINIDDDKELGQSEILQRFIEMTLASPLKKVLLIQKNQYKLLPELQSIPKEWSRKIHSQFGILVQCRIPETQKLIGLSENINKLIYIRNCKNSNSTEQSQVAIDLNKLNINLNGAFDLNFKQFALENPQVQFIQFHLPSLKFALSKQNLNPIFLLQQKLWNSPFFRDIGWQSPVWDNEIKAFRAQAAVDAIEVYRSDLVPSS